MVYYFKEKPYKVFHESKIKLDGILQEIAKALERQMITTEEYELLKDKWMPVIIYETLYDNPDGKFWVRETNEFKQKFEKMLTENKELVDSVDEFARLMKERLIAKSVEGREGWKNSSRDEVANEISERLDRMLIKDEDAAYLFIGIANWALIGYNRAITNDENFNK